MNIDGKEVERFGDKPRGAMQKSQETRNYTNPDPLNAGLEGSNVSISLLNGKTESGKLVRTGQYFLELSVKGNKLIIAKSAIITVSVIS